MLWLGQSTHSHSACTAPCRPQLTLLLSPSFSSTTRRRRCRCSTYHRLPPWLRGRTSTWPSTKRSACSPTRHVHVHTRTRANAHTRTRANAHTRTEMTTAHPPTHPPTQLATTTPPHTPPHLAKACGRAMSGPGDGQNGACWAMAATASTISRIARSSYRMSPRASQPRCVGGGGGVGGHVAGAIGKAPCFGAAHDTPCGRGWRRRFSSSRACRRCRSHAARITASPSARMAPALPGETASTAGRCCCPGAGGDGCSAACSPARSTSPRNLYTALSAKRLFCQAWPQGFSSKVGANRIGGGAGEAGVGGAGTHGRVGLSHLAQRGRVQGPAVSVHVVRCCPQGGSLRNGLTCGLKLGKEGARACPLTFSLSPLPSPQGALQGAHPGLLDVSEARGRPSRLERPLLRRGPLP